jgi:hypothetical protein
MNNIFQKCRRKRPLPNLRNSFETCLDKPRKTTRNCEVTWSPSRDLNVDPPEYGAGVLKIQVTFAANRKKKRNGSTDILDFSSALKEIMLHIISGFSWLKIRFSDGLFWIYLHAIWNNKDEIQVASVLPHWSNKFSKYTHFYLPCLM